MKKIVIAFCLLFIAKLQAQTNADCINAIPLCSTPNFTFFPTAGNGSVNDIPTGSNISNPSTNPNPPNSGCLLSGENVPQWLIITIGNPGNLEFVFGAGGSANPQVGYYDWAMWPYSPATCSQIMANTLAPIRCNWNAISTGGTGIASAANYATFGGNAGNFQPPLAVNACQQFIICISNFSGVNTLVSFQSLGTASLSCSPNCNPNYSICAGNSATITPVNYGGLTGNTYSIQPGGITNTTGSFIVSPSITTTYTTYITGTNSSGAVQTLTGTSNVTVSPTPLLAPTFTQATCTNTLNAVNLNLTFNPSSATPTYTVLWSPTPSTLSASQTQGQGLPAGTTNVTVTAAGGCSATTNFTMNAVTIPTFTLTNNTGSFSLTCTNPTINLSVATSYTPPANWLWINGSSSFTSNASNVNLTGSTAVGVYTVSLKDPITNCSTSQTFAIGQSTAIPSNTVLPASQIINCNAGAATFTSSISSPTANVTTSWFYPGSSFPSGPSLISNNVPTTIGSPPTPGTVIVQTCNNFNGCCNTKTVTVTSTAAFPTFNATSTTNFTLGCAPSNSTTLCMANGSSTNGPVQYAFLLPTSTATIPLPVSSFGPLSCTTTAVPGTWTLVVLDPVSGCQTPLPVILLTNTVAPDVSAILPSYTLTCASPTLPAVGTTSTNGATVGWLLPSTPPSINNPSITVGASTGTFVGTGPNTNTTLPNAYAIYTVVATNTVSQCKSTQTVQIYQNFYTPKNIGIAISSPSNITCSNFSVTLSFTNVALSYTGGVAVPSNTWIAPPPVINTSTLSTYLALNTGEYTLTVMDSKNSCVSSKVYTVYPNLSKPVLAPIPNFSLDCAATLSNTATQIQIALTSSLTNGWSLLFTNYPPGTAFSNFNLTNPPNGATVTPLSAINTTFTVDKIGDYRFTAKNLYTGCVEVGTLSVLPGGLNVDFVPSVTSGYSPLNVSFTNLSASSSTATGSTSVTSVWSFGNGIVQTTTTNINTNTTYNNPGTYTVLLISSKGTCIDSAYKVIRVDIPSKLDIPNVFTPNGDGSNDVFFLKTSNLTDITALIFDRWGNKVYDVTSSTGNIAWDGKNQSGKDCPAGTYFYIIKATGKDGTTYDKKGNVSLYR